ncbi:hypothetical protein [Aquipuribacter sp. SD81]|uniref:hypothetical protein n=1 Tax=Aquipuribacter sp. SD81 TaxID=3127703 RepID=UPI00301A1B54
MLSHPFVGREAELSVLSEKVQAGRHVVVRGPPLLIHGGGGRPPPRERVRPRPTGVRVAA